MPLGPDQAALQLGRPSPPAIEIAGLSHWYGEGKMRRQVLEGVDLSIASGEVVLLTGPSGCGKTTLLTLVGALRQVQAGQVKVFGQELAADLRPGLSYRARRDQAREWLRAVGLGDQLHKLPHDLSGGQKQRVAIARALATHPRLLLADEPTAALDSRTGRDVVVLLHGLAKQQGCGVLMVTHDPRILDLADRVLRMEDGRVVDTASADSVTAGALAASEAGAS